MKKVLVIVGQTATGKTNLAFSLAEKLDGEIISADSRQVYREMDIGTGKDIPNKNIPIYGLDLVNPDEEFSVAHYRQYALQKIDEIISKSKLPIIVGGTGFYIDAIFNNQNNLINIPKNENLRSELENKSASELFEILENLDKKLAENLNNSEKNNSQRLIRRVEIAKSHINKQKEINNKFDCLVIGLKLDKLMLKERIDARIQKRIDQGFEQEYKNLINKYGELDIFKNTLGYGQWPDLDKWLTEELKYAKRQLTWFKRNKNINWFDASLPSLPAIVEDFVSKWYSKS